jgi:exonuclease 3'-5' domain-containing protein 1
MGAAQSTLAPAFGADITRSIVPTTSASPSPANPRTWRLTDLNTRIPSPPDTGRRLSQDILYKVYSYVRQRYIDYHTTKAISNVARGQLHHSLLGYDLSANIKLPVKFKSGIPRPKSSNLPGNIVKRGEVKTNLFYFPELPTDFRTFGPTDNCINPFTSMLTPELKILVPHQLIIMVDNATVLDEFLTNLEQVEVGVAELFFDGEGKDYGLHGTLSTLQATFASLPGIAYILDVIALGSELFTKKSKTSGISLRSILEHPRIPKVWFDIRQDSAIIFGTAGFVMKGCYDLQLMHLGFSLTGRSYLYGLSKCIKEHLRLGTFEFDEWDGKKRAGSAAANPDFTHWLQRPLPQVLIDYAAGDTLYMPHLYHVYLQVIRKHRKIARLVTRESKARILQNISGSHDPRSVGSGSSAPQSFRNLIPLWSESGRAKSWDDPDHPDNAFAKEAEDRGFTFEW